MIMLFIPTIKIKSHQKYDIYPIHESFRANGIL